MTENERTERLLAETAWLQALTRSLVADRDVAADVAQQTLLVAWRGRLAGVVEIRPWLATVARNLARRMARSEDRRRRHEAQLPPPGEVPSTADVVEKASMQRDVVDATLQLAEPYRTTLLLRFQEDLAYEQIALRMAVPLETVRTRIKRGLKQLRARLDERHGEAKAWAVPILGVTGYQGALAHAAPIAAASAAGGAAVTGAGVLLMSLQAKVVAAAVVMLAAFSAWQLWPQRQPERPQQRQAATVPAAAAGADVAGPRADDAAAFAAELQRLLVPAPSEAAATSAAAPFADGAAITVIGRVVDEVSGRPLAGAHVSFGPSGVRFTPTGAPEPLPETVVVIDADAEGRFALPGNHGSGNELQIDAEGHAMANVPLLEAMARARLAGTETVDLGDILVPIGTQLRGRVLAADGMTPVPSARLAICRIGASIRVEVVGETGGDGSFALSRPLAPGHERAFLVADRAANGSPSGIGWRELDVSRRASVQSGFDITLLPAADVVVRIVDDAGRPIADATMTMWALNFITYGDGMPRLAVGGVSDWNNWRYGEARTDALGVATIAGRPVGPDQRWAGKMLHGSAYAISVRAAGHRGDYRELLLRPGRNELDFVLARSAEATVRGVVVEQGSGRGIAEAAIAILGAGDQGSARSDAQGAFACERIDLQKGVLTLRASAPGYRARSIVEPIAGRSGDLELRIELAAAVSVTGVVVDQDGAPIAAVAVWLGDQYRMSAADGSFAFDAVAKDQLLLRVVPTPAPGISIAALAAQLVDTRQPVAPLRLVLQRRGEVGAGTEVEFTICESAAGRALEPAIAALAPVDAKDTITGVMLPLEPFVGGARAKDVPPGRYQLRIETREGHRGLRTVEIPSGVERFAERIELDAPGSVAVTVDLSTVPAASRPAQLQFELSPWDAGHFGARNHKDVGDQRLFWFCLDLTSGSAFDLEGVVPDAPCKLTVRDAQFTGELEVTARSGQRATATLRVRPK